MRTGSIILILTLIITTSVCAQDFSLNIPTFQQDYTVPVDTIPRRLYLLQEFMEWDWAGGLQRLEFTFHNTGPRPVVYTFAGLIQGNLMTDLMIDTLDFQVTPYSNLDSVATGQFNTPNGLASGFRYFDFPGDSVSGIALDFPLDTLGMGEQYHSIWYQADTLSDWSPFQPMEAGNIWKFAGAYPIYRQERLEVTEATTSGDTTIYTVSRQREFIDEYGEGIITDTGQVFTRSSARYSIGYYSGAYINPLICSFLPAWPPDNPWTLEGLFPYADGSLDYGDMLLFGGAGLRRYGIGYHLSTGDNIGIVHRLIGYRVGDEEWGDVDVLVDIKDEPNLPIEFQLSIYPNPFNSSTTIRYSIPENGLVNLTIYDQLGRRVKTLVNRQQTAGEYQIRWDGLDDAGRQLSSGLYFCQIRAEVFVKTRKLVLLR